MRSMRRLRRALLVVLLSVGCVLMWVAPALAVQWGQSDGTNHPYVCLVVFYDQAGNRLWRTTGALISPTVVLTAAHGTEGTASAKVWFLPEIPANAPPDADPPGYPYGGPDSYAGKPHTNPQYRWMEDQGEPGLDIIDYHDVGVVVLDDPAPVTQFAQLPTKGFVDTLPMLQPVDIVGYGVNYQVHGGGVGPYDSWAWSRQRQYAPSQLIRTKSVTSGEFLQLTANPAMGKGGTTFGDSGGPILKAGTNIVLGLNSYVMSSNCRGVTFAQRVDIEDILGWVNSFVE